MKVKIEEGTGWGIGLFVKPYIFGILFLKWQIRFYFSQSTT